MRGWDGVMQSWYVDEWSDRGLFLEATFTPLAFGAHWLPGTGVEFSERVERYGNLAIIGVHLSEPGSRGRVRASRGRMRIGYRLSEDDVAAIRYGIARAADIHFAAGAVEVYPQLAGLPVVGRDEGSAPIESREVPARDLRLEAFHPMGTARMGADPRDLSCLGPARPRRRGSLHRRRFDLPDVPARQPDDHDHGLRPA